MADNRIEVEWITTVAGALQAIEKLNKRIDSQEQALSRIGPTSKKSAEMAVNSFNKLEQELKQGQAALKGMTVGTAEFDKQRQKVDRMAKAFAEVKKEINGTAGETGSLLDQGVEKLGAMVGGMQALNMLASALVEELDKVKTLRIEAAATTRSVEQAVAAMALNIGAANVPEAMQIIRERAPQIGVSQEGFANLIAAAISGGAEDIKEAAKLSELTLGLTAGDAAKAAPIMSGMLSLAATTGNRNFEQVLGQLSQFQEAARGEDLATSINNMSTAMAAANAAGVRVAPLGGERTLELSSVISQVLQDPRMAVTGTTLRQMVQKIDAFVPKEEMKLRDGTTVALDQATIAGFNQLGTVDARMQAMRANPELAKQFLNTIEESEGKVAIRELVTGSQRVLELEKIAAQKVTSEQEAKTAFDELMRAITANTMLTQMENKSQANLQGLEVGSQRGTEGQVQKIIEDTLSKINLSGLDADTQRKVRWGMEAAVASGTSVPRAGINALREAQQPRRLFGVVPVGGQVSDEERAIIERQIKLLESLERILQDQQKANAAKQPALRPKAAPLPAATAP